MITRRIQHVAEGIAYRLPLVLAKRKLAPAIARYVLTEVKGLPLLVAPLDAQRLERLEQYISEDLLRQITAETGYPVFLASKGMGYVFVLGQLPRLPKRVEFPLDAPMNLVSVGEGISGPISLRWQDLGHVLVAGQTGSGKSVFLRLLVYQALRDGMSLLLSDLDQATFPMLAGHQQLLADIASTPESGVLLVQHALAECDRRAELFQKVTGFPDTLEEYNRLAVQSGQSVLPRVLVVLDEFSALASSAPQIRQQIAALGWRGRKFGVQVVFAAQEFTKEIVGPIREQVNTAVCFRVRSGEMAKRVHCAGAESISPQRPGLALTDRWGMVQTYFVDKSLLGEVRPALREEEIEIVRKAGEGGQVSIPKLVGWGWSEWRARKLLDEWEQRGWVVREGTNRKITPNLREIASNPQAPQTASNLSNLSSNPSNRSNNNAEILADKE